MCGIAGCLSLEGRPVDEDVVRRMIGIVRHRGPDGAGIHADGNAALGHARLSIIDLGGGAQPMSNEDGSLWVTFNGEIFNYVELRQLLLDRGHRFATSSDTEVILHLYEEEGEDCVHRFNGQWAFAIWDQKRRSLFLSRDRLGVRPLFYTVTPTGEFLFASEVKSLFVHPEVERGVDLRGLDQVFTFWTTVPPATVFKGVSELPPGHSLTVRDGQVRAKRYWRLDFSSAAAPVSEADCADRLLELLLDATRLRLRSDVPVGAYLSGGLDSSLVTALIRRYSDAKLKTFSVGFQDPEFDETRFQKEVIEFLHTEHHEIRCTYEDIAQAFPQVVWHAEKPILRTAPAPLFYLSRLAHEHGCKVVLSGEGSDELLGGYDIYKEAKIRSFWAARPESRLRPLLLRRLYPYLQTLQSQSPAYLRAFFQVRPGDLSSPYFSHLPRWDLTSKLKLFFSREVKAELASYDCYQDLESSIPEGFGKWDLFSRAQFLESSCLLPGYILSSQGDRMAMAHSVEVRFPFLDHRVVEFSATIPPRLKMKALDEKHVLKRAAGTLIPASVKNRHKQPYRAPDARSFLAPGRADEGALELLSEKRLREDGLFEPTAVRGLVEKAEKGLAIGMKDNMALVGILSTQLLAQLFLRAFPNGRSAAR